MSKTKISVLGGAQGLPERQPGVQQAEPDRLAHLPVAQHLPSPGRRHQCRTTRLSPAPALLPRIDVELRRFAWGVLRTECHPTYDHVPEQESICKWTCNGGQ